jgi:hypothetical protein
VDNADDNLRTLFPLSFALATGDHKAPATPIITWSTLLLPFFFSSISMWPTLGYKQPVDVTASVHDVEVWANIVAKSHALSADIAARRLVSAISARTDSADSLIDAVMVWESLVGTATEVTFRVTAALAKLLATTPLQRRALRKELSEIYGLRSRVVHGVRVDEGEIYRASRRAIEVAAQALRASYERGADWLDRTSEDRANEILLEWP